MKYYVDCEFNGRGGDLLSIALVSETDKSMYVVMGQYRGELQPWVAQNVIPVMMDMHLDDAYPCIFGATQEMLTAALEEFLRPDAQPHFIADNEQDIMYLCDALVGPKYVPDKQCVDLKFSVKRVDAYPTTLKGAVQHNAWWDAQALRTFFVGPEYE